MRPSEQPPEARKGVFILRQSISGCTFLDVFNALIKKKRKKRRKGRGRKGLGGRRERKGF
jgi:hypothetical protein